VVRRVASSRRVPEARLVRLAPDDPGWTQPWAEAPTHLARAGGAYYYGVFWGGMPDLNFATPAVREEMKRIASALARPRGRRLPPGRHPAPLRRRPRRAPERPAADVRSPGRARRHTCARRAPGPCWWGRTGRRRRDRPLLRLAPGGDELQLPPWPRRSSRARRRGGRRHRGQAPGDGRALPARRARRAIPDQPRHAAPRHPARRGPAEAARRRGRAAHPARRSLPLLRGGGRPAKRPRPRGPAQAHPDAVGRRRARASRPRRRGSRRRPGASVPTSPPRPATASRCSPSTGDGSRCASACRRWRAASCVCTPPATRARRCCCSSAGPTAAACWWHTTSGPRRPVPRCRSPASPSTWKAEAAPAGASAALRSSCRPTRARSSRWTESGYFTSAGTIPGSTTGREPSRA
jgi:hypothetical protein